MRLSLRTLNRLWAGGDIAARVEAINPNYLAWVYIYPLAERQEDCITYTPSHEVCLPDGSVVDGYLVRYLEVAEEEVIAHNEERIENIHNAAYDHQVKVVGDEDMEKVISQWPVDFNSFHIPCDVGYNFELGPDLL